MSANPQIASLGAWANIPEELRALRQWWLSAPADDPHGGKRPLFMSSFGLLTNASVKQANNLYTFEEVCALAFAQRAKGNAVGIGLLLTKDDPYFIIDLDDKETNPATEQDKERFGAIIRTMDSYTEVSQSGRGVHIVVRANTTQNRRNGRVEAYSCKRFMVMTGQSIPANPKPIADRSDIVFNMLTQMEDTDTGETIELDDEGKEQYKDAEVWEQACAATNGEKFQNLFAGNFADYFGADGESEGDAALMQFFWFYSRNKTQTVRMFMASEMGKREKCTKRFQDYVVNRTLGQAMRKLHQDESFGAIVSFDEIFFGLTPPKLPKVELELVVDNTQERPPEVDISGLLAQYEAKAVGEPPKIDRRQMVITLPKSMQEVPLPEPQGNLKRLVEYIEASAVYPIRAHALSAALGILSGIAGAAYQTYTGTGLNQYLILVAVTGTGKELQRIATENILNAYEQTGKGTIRQFVEFDSYNSPEALFADGIVGRTVSNSMVHMSSEWGLRLEEMNNPGKSAASAAYTRIQNEMYMKSGATSIVQAHRVRNKENTTVSRGSFAYSICSETNPHSFFSNVDPSMFENGLLSRLTVIEFTGKTPPRSRNILRGVPEAVLEDLNALATQVTTISQQIATPNMLQRPASGTYEVQWSDSARHLQEEYWDYADMQRNSFQVMDGTPDVRLHLWNRSNLKVMRMAALLAVYENPIRPIVTDEMVRWAIALEKHSFSAFERRISSGELGERGLRAYTKLKDVMTKYAAGEYTIGRELDRRLHQHHVISRSFVRAQIGGEMSRLFGEKADEMLDKAYRQFVLEGRVTELDRIQVKNQFGTTAKCYRILDMTDFKED